jgi:hypothetical protein
VFGLPPGRGDHGCCCFSAEGPDQAGESCYPISLSFPLLHSVHRLLVSVRRLSVPARLTDAPRHGVAWLADRGVPSITSLQPRRSQTGHSRPPRSDGSHPRPLPRAENTSRRGINGAKSCYGESSISCRPSSHLLHARISSLCRWQLNGRLAFLLVLTSFRFRVRNILVLVLKSHGHWGMHAYEYIPPRHISCAGHRPAKPG